MVFTKNTSAAVLAITTVVLTPSAASAGLQERIDAAKPGATITVSIGSYQGPVTIAKAIKLVGKGQPVIDGDGRGSVVSVIADGVEIRGFRIVGSGINLMKDEAGIHVTGNDVAIVGNVIEDALHGIYLKQCKGFRVSGNTIKGKTTLPPVERPTSETIATDGAEYCAPLNVNSRGNGIHLWNSSGGELDGNVITDTRDGMYFSFTRDTRVRANRISGVRYGLHYMYSDSNVFEGNSFQDNAAGAAIMYSKKLIVRGNRFHASRGFRAYGLLLNSVDETRLERNFITKNTVGIYLENNNNNLITGNEIKNNYIGIRMTASSNDNGFSRNRFAGNLHPAELAGQNDSNRWSIAGVGNYWQSSSPVDLDGDGIGELPHREVDLLGGMRRELPMVSLLSGSPALKLLEFGERHVPLPGADAIEDPAPLSPHFREP
jgi:nitrous oxidase accessory protein